MPPPAVAPLRSPAQPRAGLALQAAVLHEPSVDDRPRVEVPPRPLARGAAVEDRSPVLRRQGAADDPDSAAIPGGRGDHHARAVGGAVHAECVRDGPLVLLRGPEDEVRAPAGVLERPACGEDRQAGQALDVNSDATEATVRIADPAALRQAWDGISSFRDLADRIESGVFRHQFT